ncbi:glycoside hydrolase 43 family protein [Flavobacterium sp. Fl-77]|uniref:Glycoside hydrolase 43 family protein n=1 Tax=Flavobacterium flavipigmentatum TaxID=2893884 RepID=A0AAJ2W2B8_9FLAO|nr:MULTISPECIES: glycoside hydrolase 43 family protein [unclassified Flavobacterium]MDX6183628.1 glycoside hydrolase 43 family protein [Flavobacterium sp. Fl-33]MDX6187180.1 glycoside hydrolase 43 family protein [Flavobacterium sp. Fl-77]UFH38009.1 glycoside hydrolase 43 family protein [Flavobacterium sp. F-70]
MKYSKSIFLCLFFLLMQKDFAQEKPFVSQVWVSDNGNGTYTNPIIHADYSDPDVVRVGDDFYMTASSFNAIPGLPILHSKDLVNWKIISYALAKQIPTETFDKVQHGNGVWAPSINFHNNEFYIYYPDPDFGIYMIKAKKAEGPWSEPIMVKAGKGLIDPSPLWDTDGKAYLAHAFAGSRAKIKTLLVVCSMNLEGTIASNDAVMIIDGHEDEGTIEGPKFYKRNNYYYIFAPAGGVATGWQTVLRSKNVFGPYEKRKVLEEGKSKINGPHQGAWVQTQTGEDWFIHFQDRGAYGRIAHLQPMKWENDWPVMGVDVDKNGIGEPVATFKKPNVGKTYPIETPADSDEFNTPKLGLQWQWQANDQSNWGFPTSLGYFNLYCLPAPKEAKGIFDLPNMLLQKFPAEEFTATAKLTFNSRIDGESTGLMIMGLDYSCLSLKSDNGKLYLNQKNGAFDKVISETETAPVAITNKTVYLRVKVKKGAICSFFYSLDDKNYQSIGKDFTAKEGKWIGAKMGFFALSPKVTNDSGNVAIDWFRITK